MTAFKPITTKRSKGLPENGKKKKEQKIKEELITLEEEHIRDGLFRRSHYRIQNPLCLLPFKRSFFCYWSAHVSCWTTSLLRNRLGTRQY